MKINFLKNNRLLVLLRSTENDNDTDEKSHAKKYRRNMAPITFLGR